MIELLGLLRKQFKQNESVAMSKMGPDEWLQLRAALSLPPDKEITVSHRASSVHEAFKWDDRYEPLQADRYIPWLTSAVDSKHHIEVLNGNGDSKDDSQKISLAIPLLKGLPFRLKGFPDVVLATCGSFSVLRRIVFVLELKPPAKVPFIYYEC